MARIVSLVLAVVLASPLAAAAQQGTRSLPDFTRLMKEQGPAVVNILTKAKAAPSPQAGAGASAPPPGVPEDLYEFFRRFMPEQPPGGTPRAGMGSGFIISADGYVLTNAHVVAGADEVLVRLADAKREFKAKVIGADERTDVALLKVEAQGLPTVRLADSSKVQPGEWVAAIGAPFGFANTITAGIVSATGRALPSGIYVPFIQTDVAVNPGNSGGPLLNLAGDVVGVNSMIYSGTGGYMGVSFAIPIEVALDVSRQLQATGKVTRGRLGVAIQPVTRELAEAFGMKEPQGALIAQVEPGSPAQNAGLRPGDIVVAYRGKAVEDPNELPRHVAATKPGERAELEVLRDGKREKLAVTIGELKPERPSAQGKTAPQAGESTPGLGIMVSELPPAERKALGVDYAVIIEGVQNRNLPLRPGDVIVAVNRQKFASMEEFRKLIAEHRGAKVALLVRRGEATLFVPVDVG